MAKIENPVSFIYTDTEEIVGPSANDLFVLQRGVMFVFFEQIDGFFDFFLNLCIFEPCAIFAVKIVNLDMHV